MEDTRWKMKPKWKLLKENGSPTAAAAPHVTSEARLVADAMLKNAEKKQAIGRDMDIGVP